MLTLRLTQHTDSPDHYHVELALEGDGLLRQTANPRFEFQLSEQDYDDIRWYLEDFLQYPLDPEPIRAGNIERRMAEIGTQLFKAVFQSDDDARDLWATLRTRLNDTRVEVITEVKEAASIPWELLRDPKTDVALALRAQAFVRAQPNAAQQPALPHTAEGEPIRILLVICRPGGRADVPFRSVASRIIKGLTDEAREHFQLDVLRPPTFEQLSRVLHEAKTNGKPCHVIHFDGHGLYAEPQPSGASFNRLLFSDNRTGKHGYLAFENPQREDNLEPISGPQLGALLVETQTPVLVLNACRSAHADSPSPVDDSGAAASTGEVRERANDPHSRVRAFGSLAQEVMDAGVAGVVAMRYNVYVVTAAQFVAELYAALAQGQSLGEAVTLGRKQLAAQPLRAIAYDPVPLQDWSVPIVYEAAPIQLFPKQAKSAEIKISLQPPREASDVQSPADGLPPRPDVGFFGRDETLLALDRAFDTQRVVLLWAYAGSGKTTTAVEFARWYKQTGGLEGPVLFTSFELRAGQAILADEQEQGRSRSLGASLSYGFATAFAEYEHKVLALLHFFQGFVDVDALRIMGNSDNDWCLPEVRALTRESGIALLNRAAEVGLLTAHGGGYYSIHTALPWYFNAFFRQYYPDEQAALSIPPSALSPAHVLSESEEHQPAYPSATRAFVEAIGELSEYYSDEYEHGDNDVIAVLEREEDNLLYACRLARTYGWWFALMKTMQSLHVLYGHLGRRAEWQRLVEEIVPNFVDATTDGPLAGCEELLWGYVTGYRVQLAIQAHDLAKAERLQHVQIDWIRRRTTPMSAIASEMLDEAGRADSHRLASSLGNLGQIQCMQSKAECTIAFQEAISLCQHINDKPGEAIVAFNLGHAYKGIPDIRNLDQAEHWYRHSLELRDERDHKGQGDCFAQLGFVAYERFVDAKAENQPEEKLLYHLQVAAGFYEQALKLLPSNAAESLAVIHNSLGGIYVSADNLGQALSHSRESIRLKELTGNIYGAANTRFSVALALADAGRLNDALLYAQAALRNYAAYGDRVAAEMQKTQELIAWIEGNMK